jgi:hypothetical protein
MKKLIYVASPYNHPQDEIRIKNYEIVSLYTAKLIAEGKVAISPIAYGHPLLSFVEIPYDWQFWSNFCLSFLDVCTEMHVLKMEGWDKSRGVAEEIEYAKQKNIEIKYVEL